MILYINIKCVNFIKCIESIKFDFSKKIDAFIYWIDNLRTHQNNCSI